MNIKPVLGYTTAVLLILLLAFSIIQRQELAKLLVKTTGIHPTYWYSGGVAAQTIKRDNYELIVNHPVFQTIFGDLRDGFVQFRYKAKETLPPRIQEQVVIDGYNFTADVDTKKLTAQLLKTDGYALKPVWVLRFSDNSVVVRIKLENRNCGTFCKALSSALAPLQLFNLTAL